MTDSHSRRTDSHVGTVYLIHFSGPTATGHQHYLGWSNEVIKRFKRHQTGRGAEETRRALAEGLKLTLAQTWRGTLADEQRIKRERRLVRRGYACLCPFCAEEDPLADGLVRGMGPPTLRLARSSLAIDSVAVSRTNEHDQSA